MTTALLVMDFQPAVLGMVGGDDCPALAQAVAAAEVARKNGVAVIFVRMALRPGYPEVSPRNKGLAPLGDYGDVFIESSPATQVHPALGPRDGDFVVTKRRYGAFASDIDTLLRGRGVDHLVLAGVATSGVVLTTVREAADRDFTLTVLSDACADADPELHDVLATKVFPTQADVVTTADWTSNL